MRTLKKTLCLVLCLAMMVGLCAFGASATFDDADKIQNTEAVDLLTGLGVITGMDDGTFNPTGTLTRAQAAAIITRLLGLGELAKAATVFSDVPADHWASGYIALCSSQGIIAGLGDGTFNPEGKLKGYEWAKMLLCALGYDAKQEGLVGADFEINVERLVKKTLLADGIKFIGTAEISRDDACQLGYNALTVPMVEYNGGTQVSTSDGTQVTVNANLLTMRGYLATQNFKMAVVAGAGGTTQDKDSFADAGATAVIVKGVIKENSANNDVKTSTLWDPTTNTNAVYNIDTDNSLLGHYVKIYRNATAKADGSFDAYSVLDASKVVKIGATAPNTAAKFKKAFGVDAAVITYPGAGVMKFGAPGAPAVGATTVVPGTPTCNANTTYILDPTNQLVCEIPAAYATVTLDAVDKIVTTAGKETIKFKGTAALSNGKKNAAGLAEDFVREYDGIAEGDIVVLTQMGAIYNVYKADVVEGKVSEVDTDNVVTLAGTKYEPNAAVAADNTGLAGAGLPANGAAMKANTYKLYLDEDGNYVGCFVVAGESTVSAALYIVAEYHKSEDTGYGTKDNYYAQVVDMTGKEDKVLIGIDANADGDTADANDYGVTTTGLVGKFVTFDKSAVAAAAKLGVKTATTLPADISGVGIAPVVNQAQAVLTDTDLGTAGAQTKLTSKTSKIEVTGAKPVYLSSDTLFIFINGALGQMEITKKTGAVDMNMTLLNTKVLFKAADADRNRVAQVVVYDGAFADAGADASTLIYVPAATTYSAENVDGFVYTVYNAATGEKITVTNKSDIDPLSIGFHKFAVSGKVYDINGANEGTGTLVGAVYASKYGTKITTTGAAATDLETSGAIIVDTRAANAIGDEGELTSLNAIAAAAAAGAAMLTPKTVTLDIIKNASGAAAVIFVRSFA